MSEAEILFDVTDGLGVITLNRPKALNALTYGMILELEKVIPKWEKDSKIKAVVLRGAGDRAFCAGGDVTNLYRESRENPSGTLRRDFFRDEYIVIAIELDSRHFGSPPCRERRRARLAIGRRRWTSPEFSWARRESSRTCFRR